MVEFMRTITLIFTGFILNANCFSILWHDSVSDTSARAKRTNPLIPQPPPNSRLSLLSAHPNPLSHCDIFTRLCIDYLIAYLNNNKIDDDQVSALTDANAAEDQEAFSDEFVPAAALPLSSSFVEFASPAALTAALSSHSTGDERGLGLGLGATSSGFMVSDLATLARQRAAEAEMTGPARAGRTSSNVWKRNAKLSSSAGILISSPQQQQRQIPAASPQSLHGAPLATTPTSSSNAAGGGVRVLGKGKLRLSEREYREYLEWVRKLQRYQQGVFSNFG